MDKYSGMNKVECKVSENNVVKKKADSKIKVSGFLVRLVVASFAALLLFGAKFAGGVFGDAVSKVKEAVCFDFGSYVSELFGGEDK